MTESSDMAGFRNAEQKRIRKENETEENTKGIDNHRLAAKYFSLAANMHNLAAKHHDNGDHLQAYKYTLMAMGYSRLGTDCQMQDLKHHIK